MNSPSKVELSAALKASLPSRLLFILHKAGEFCQERRARLFIAGGWVRDLLLDRPGHDIDLVVEGDGLSLAGELARQTGAQITSHGRFQTARLVFEQFTLDIATSRREAYPHPGSLPSVEPAPIEKDLLRRDFTINAMAIAVSGDDFGKLIDPLEGRRDLEEGLVRILHPESFRDDATRIFRTVRYEQRFNFTIEPATLKQLKDDKSYLATISPDRLRYEFECIFNEHAPEKALGRSGELSVLGEVLPELSFQPEQYRWFEAARLYSSPEPPPAAVCFGLLSYHLEKQAAKSLGRRLNLPNETCQVITDALTLKAGLDRLEGAELQPSAVYHLLSGFHLLSVVTCLATESRPAVRRQLERYLDELRHVRPLLDGNDLKLAGVAEGPAIRQVLQAIQDARLDGKAVTLQDEIELVKSLLARRF
ncbi:MAG: CCA tRNA nucleotidyltransferase [Dehalococcoidaceae bacterium]|nr:CCA tRNA nucleotidyltransferase [Dehalococcoidaceae bacterium]